MAEALVSYLYYILSIDNQTFETQEFPLELTMIGIKLSVYTNRYRKSIKFIKIILMTHAHYHNIK